MTDTGNRWSRTHASRPVCRYALPVVVALLASGVAETARAQSSSEPLESAKAAVVMVLAVDFVDGRLVPMASGSGTIISPNGSVLTSYHVLFDAEKMRHRDLFLIGRYRAADREPELVCAGKPNLGVHKEDVDLSLIRCHLDMSGRRQLPVNWPSMPRRKLERDDIVPGERVWMLGYPNVGSSNVRATRGLVSGWTDEHGGTGRRTFARTDAPITRGYSGGAAIDAHGNFFGIPTAYRTTTAHNGTVFTASKESLIRPLEDAADLLERARSNWTPGASSSASRDRQSAPEGVVVSGRVVDAASGRPAHNAMVVILRPGLLATDLDPEDLESATLSWGVSGRSGSFELSPPVPRGERYSLLVMSRGYLPLRRDFALTVPDDSPNAVRPWPSLILRRH